MDIFAIVTRPSFRTSAGNAKNECASFHIRRFFGSRSGLQLFHQCGSAQVKLRKGCLAKGTGGI